MKRCSAIVKHKKYREYLANIEECEKERIYCHHDMVHFLDVARIAWIYALEEQIEVDKEIVYSTALVHDIGRHLEYRSGIPHEIASADLAQEILADCGFDAEEQIYILDAVRNHRNKEIAPERSLRGLLYRADKKSRGCSFCKAESSCHWTKSKKNMSIEV